MTWNKAFAKAVEFVSKDTNYELRKIEPLESSTRNGEYTYILLGIEAVDPTDKEEHRWRTRLVVESFGRSTVVRYLGERDDLHLHIRMWVKQ